MQIEIEEVNGECFQSCREGNEIFRVRPIDRASERSVSVLRRRKRRKRHLFGGKVNTKNSLMSTRKRKANIFPLERLSQQISSEMETISAHGRGNQLSWAERSGAEHGDDCFCFVSERASEWTQSKSHEYGLAYCSKSAFIQLVKRAGFWRKLN